jgi:hypothetical protein
MKRLRIITWMIVAALLLASCTNGEPNPADTTQAPSNAPTAVSSVPPTSAANPGYPAQGQPAEPTVAAVNSSYPAPDNGQATPTALPTPLTLRPPASGKANIHGFLTSGSDKQPYVADLVLEGTVAASQPGYPPMLKYTDNSPQAVQDKTGLFVFFDVDPGTYGLVISSPIGGSTINDPTQSTPQPLIFTVKAGEDKDLGTLNIP